MHTDGTYKSKTDIIFGFSDFLQTVYLETQYLAICNIDDKVVVEWSGSTGFDYELEIYLINFQVVLHKNGTVQWNFKEMNWNTSNQDNYYYDKFSGLYAKEENLEVTAGYAINTQGSYYYIQDLSSSVLMGEITGNNITNNTIGIYSENSDTSINSNFVCGNIEWDFNSSNWLMTSGDNNTCDKSDGWDDDGKTGCTNSCPHPCYCSSCDDCEEKLNNDSCNYVILNESITNHTGTCIDFPANDKVFDCDGNVIDGEGVDSGTDYGIYLNNKTKNTIRNCMITDFDQGIYLDYSSYIIIMNNTANSNYGTSGCGIGLFFSSNNTLKNNTANSNSNTGIYLDASSNNSIINNRLSLNDVGIRLINSGGSNIINNTANSNSYYGIYLDNSSSNILTENTANNNVLNGIYLVSSNYNGLRDNLVNNNNIGIYLISLSDGNSVTNNTANSNTHAGISLRYSSHNNLTNNTANSNGYRGILLNSQSNDNDLTNNHVCVNANKDIYNLGSNSGNNNTCDTGNWNDDEIEGCWYTCSGLPSMCDLNRDGIYIRDYNDLMLAYKCFLGIKNCNKINEKDWANMKKEYNCFINNL